PLGGGRNKAPGGGLAKPGVAQPTSRPHCAGAPPPGAPPGPPGPLGQAPLPLSLGQAPLPPLSLGQPPDLPPGPPGPPAPGPPSGPSLPLGLPWGSPSWAFSLSESSTRGLRTTWSPSWSPSETSAILSLLMPITTSRCSGPLGVATKTLRLLPISAEPR